MQLLFDREQVSGARAPKFKLMAKIELDEQEKAIVAHYRLDKALLIDKFDEELVKQTAMLVVVAFLVGFVVFTAMFGWTTASCWHWLRPVAADGTTGTRTGSSSLSATC